MNCRFQHKTQKAAAWATSQSDPDMEPEQPEIDYHQVHSTLAKGCRKTSSNTNVTTEEDGSFLWGETGWLSIPVFWKLVPLQVYTSRVCFYFVLDMVSL